MEKAIRVVEILIAGQSFVDPLAKQITKGKLRVLTATFIHQVVGSRLAPPRAIHSTPGPETVRHRR
jgi:hypothetical protein